ncbi:caspase family protein [Microcoleus sp. FACHB-1515]|uniref:caspase family protein n=1 Tax=Cyanophyceae TaxID=3028117 RepID=UPI00168600E6|nr:caspase family protein [Microcoleus sp. FACHB-1515]MBD2091279.1 caspase family protein [Microcoleus sp. FACHB-1515]
MSQMKRRHFLQFAGSTLATIGLSQFDFFQQADRYGRVLAQGTPRKLALLVGINRYPESVSSLRGCLTDVQLQKHLLIHRFGFNPADILEVSDTADVEPNRDNIIRAFEEHLIRQAKPGDVVVFHYSGHGDRIRDPNPLDTEECRAIGDCGLNGTIVPNDATIDRQGSEIIVPDIMGRTLFLLMKRIDTENLTVILDSCHSGAGTRGNVRVRAANSRARAGTDDILVPSAAELQAQETLRSQSNLSISDFQRLRQLGIAKGVAIGSAQRDQLAIDAAISDFYAGAFTYLLTRYLWQITSTRSAEAVYSDLERSTRSLAQSTSNREQVPTFEYQPESNNLQQPIYFTNLVSPPAEAVLTSVDPPQFWLGGVSSQNLSGTAGSIFSVLNAAGEEVGAIEQTRRVGLSGEGRVTQGQAADLREGMLLRERIVGIPANPMLKVGVDRSLAAEAQTARTELAATSRVEVVDSEGAIDCWLGRFTEEDQQRLSAEGEADLPSVGSIGLFQPDLTRLVDSFGLAREPAIAAIDRLRPRFKQMLARQLLAQLLTAGTGSPLRVEATVFAAGSRGNTLQVMTRGAQEIQTTAIDTSTVQFRSGSNLQVEINNLETEQDLYLSILVINADGVMDVLYPAEWTAPEEAARIFRGQKLTMPRPQDETTFTVEGTGGFLELLILVSKEPLRQALSVMQSIARGRGQSRGALGGLSGDEPLDVLDQLLGDLNNLSRSIDRPTGGVRARNNTIAYDTATLAVLSAVFEVVA